MLQAMMISCYVPFSESASQAISNMCLQLRRASSA